MALCTIRNQVKLDGQILEVGSMYDLPDAVIAALPEGTVEVEAEKPKPKPVKKAEPVAKTVPAPLPDPPAEISDTVEKVKEVQATEPVKKEK